MDKSTDSSNPNIEANVCYNAVERRSQINSTLVSTEYNNVYYDVVDIDSSMDNAVERRSQNSTVVSTEYNIDNNVWYDVVENIKSASEMQENAEIHEEQETAKIEEPDYY